MSDARREQRRLRRKQQRHVEAASNAATRAWELFGAAMRFTHAKAPVGADVFNALRYGSDADGPLLDQFIALHPGLQHRDLPLIRRFRHGFSSLFYIQKRHQSFLRMNDVATGASHDVVVPRSELAGDFATDHFVGGLIVPVLDGWMLGGVLRGVRPDATETQVLQVARRIAFAEADRVRATVPNILQSMLDDLCSGFQEHFHADHVVCLPHRLAETMQEFHESWSPPQRHGYANCGRLEVTIDMDNARSLGLIADPIWGYVVLEDLDQLLLAARTQDLDRIRRWLNDASHPAAFRCAWRNHPEATEQALRAVFGQDDWAKQTEQALERNKPEFFPPRPSLIPIPANLVNAPPDEGPLPADGVGLAELLGG